MADTTVSSVRAPKVPQKDSTTQRYLPFSEIRDNCVIMKDGSSRMVLRVHAVNFNLKSEEEQDAIIYGYQRFLNSLRFPIQIIVRSLKVDIEGYVQKLKTLAVKQTNPLLQEQTYRYIDFLSNLVDMAQIMRKDFYIVVPYDTDLERSVRDPGMFGIFRSFWASITNEETVASIRDRRRRADSLKKGNLERVGQIKTALESIGLKSEELKKEELIRLMIDHYNPKLGGDNKLRADTGSLGFEP